MKTIPLAVVPRLSRGSALEGGVLMFCGNGGFRRERHLEGESGLWQLDYQRADGEKCCRDATDLAQTDYRITKSAFSEHRFSFQKSRD